MENTEVYDANDLIRYAKRENNTKRAYLLVDPLQGKHIPVSPARSFKLFSDLAEKLYSAYPKERLLIIGFAETATAIGSAVACLSPTPTWYIQTTREDLAGADYLYFSEAHSHATEQKLVANSLETMIAQTDRIIFAEDEVTTGNTIRNIICLIQEKYRDFSPKFGIVSILNGMPEDTLNQFHKEDIPCIYILRLSAEDYEDRLSPFQFEDSLKITASPSRTELPLHSLKKRCNPRLGVITDDYLTACKNLSSAIIKNISSEELKQKTVLVLGTEEFMFPAMYTGHQLEKTKLCKSVHFHATTRSPILPSSDPEYPLNCRYQLPSVYDKERTTFLYNLTAYDLVIIIHDSQKDSFSGLQCLTQALLENNCSTIKVYEWRD